MGGDWPHSLISPTKPNPTHLLCEAALTCQVASHSIFCALWPTVWAPVRTTGAHVVPSTVLHSLLTWPIDCQDTLKRAQEWYHFLDQGLRFNIL